MFHKVLIANRGEIALRIIRACRELRISTVAVFSQADRDSLHVRLADESVCIGPPAPALSYNHIPRVISAAEVTGADAVHPGYGFLAENAHFAEVCASSGFTFIGPTPEMISKMGDKAVARRTMRDAGLPVVPGSEGVLENVDEASALAREIGYPVIIKASAGGGGRGMRVAWDEKSLRTSFGIAQAEAGAAFNNNAVYLEKYIPRPRHIEFQLFGDAHGRLVHLGERECSVQRNHQKLIEEAPSPFLTPEMRRRVGEMAVRGARAIGYQNAGTMEFLFDQDGSFYFMEMNTRIQVEHPVTEEVTGLDLVKEQIRVAAGEPLSLEQDQVEWRGHAIECRINAEDHRHGFRPSPGTITYWYKPGGPGIRVDSHVYAGYVVPPYYDSMVGKLIAYGKDREEALRRMEIGLDEMIVEGIKTTIPFHHLALQHPKFRAGDLDTHFVEELLGAPETAGEPVGSAAGASGGIRGESRTSAAVSRPQDLAPAVRVSTLLAPGPEPVRRHTVAVVVDVLRATTTLTVAFANGAVAAIPVADLDEARTIRDTRPGSLLCGERDGRIVPGFDLGNSPLEYTRERVEGKVLVFASTNGSPALLRARPAREVVPGAFVNASAVLERVSRASHVSIVCAGGLGRFSLEDAGFAGWLADHLRARGATLEGPSARLVADLAPRDAAEVRALVEGSSDGRKLTRMGPAYAADVQWCATLDRLDRAFAV